MRPLFLLRYDTENDDAGEMTGFLEKVVCVHRAHDIPSTFFCTGRMLEAREEEFRDFHAEVAGDERFDLQDHSFSHIGVGYESSRPLEELRADYERSFAVHERVFGKRPSGVSLCGTGGKDGARLAGFDATDKTRAELAMLESLGARMLNTFLQARATDRAFCSYADLGYPDLMGFPSGFSDTGWMLEKTPDWQWRCREPFGEAVGEVVKTIALRGEQGIHMPLMLHDWAAWKVAPGRELDHVKRFTDVARSAGFELVTHSTCYARPELWRD